MSLSRFLPLCLVLTACGESTPEPEKPPPPQPIVLEHDFGVVPHGQEVPHDFVIDPHPLGNQLIPLGVRVDCRCASTQMLLVDSKGQERLATGQPLAMFAAGPEEKIVVRMVLQTADREAQDLPPLTSRGMLVLQPAAATNPQDRVYVQLVFRYGIDAPVVLSPAAHVDFGTVPSCDTKIARTLVRSDVPQRTVRLGTPHVGDDRIQAELEPAEDGTVLRLTLTPDDRVGPFRTEVTVDTDLDNYQLRIPVSGQVVPTIVATPMGKVSLGMFDFAQEQENFVIVTDHDLSRSPDFQVARLVDRAGKDASAHFEVRLVPIDGDPRSTRVFVKYLGGVQPPDFRGQLVLAKDPEQGPFMPIEVVAFHRK